MKPLAAILPLAAACFAAFAQQASPPPAAPPATQSQAVPSSSAQSQQPDDSLSRVLRESAQPGTSAAGTAPGAPPTAATSLATVALESVALSGSLSIENGLAFIGNNGAITATDHTARVSLTRGGMLNVCAATKINLSTDVTVSGGGLMIALDHGAFEAHYIPGQYSDVILTPDLRILISAPGQADLSIRVNRQGDTCVDNHGDHAPYVLASSLFQGGAYRVQPNQRIIFEHGSLNHVVDDESQSCGCPPAAPVPTPTTIAGVGAPGGTLRSETQKTPPPVTEEAPAGGQNAFPVAESEGLKAPPAPPSAPVVPAGQANTQITVPLVYNGETAEKTGTPDSSPAPGVPAPAPGGDAAAPPADAACKDPLFPGVVCDSNATVNQATPQDGQAASVPATPADENASPKKKRSGFVRFLRKIFGGS